MTVFLDTNILLYAAIPSAAEEGKRIVATSILSQGDYATSGQVHAEFYSVATSKTSVKITHAEALAWLERLRRFPVVAVTADLVLHGAQLADRYRINYWDGAILAAAHAIGAATMYTEDLTDGQLYGKVRARNPFVQ